MNEYSLPKAIVKPVIIPTRASSPIVMNIQPINHTARREALSNKMFNFFY